jgi:hypothetical protein
MKAKGFIEEIQKFPMVTWEEVERIYDEALRDFEKLEERDGICLFGIPASTAKETFRNKYEFSVRERLGNPDAVARDMARHAKDVLVDCNMRTALRDIVRNIQRQTGKRYIADWSWSPREGKCYLLKYEHVPEVTQHRRVVEKVEISCPKKEEDYMKANIISLMEMGRRGWLDDSLVVGREKSGGGVLANMSFINGSIVPHEVWEVTAEAERYTWDVRKKWEEIEERLRGGSQRGSAMAVAKYSGNLLRR